MRLRWHVSPHFPGSKDLKCFSLTLTHVGEEVNLPNVKVVKEKLCGLMNAGGGVSQIHEVWRQTFGSYWRNPGRTRWWATFELFEFLHNNWDTFIIFLNNCHTNDDMEIGARLTVWKELVVDNARRITVAINRNRLFEKRNSPTATVMYDLNSFHVAVCWIQGITSRARASKVKRVYPEDHRLNLGYGRFHSSSSVCCAQSEAYLRKLDYCQHTVIK